MIPKITGHAAVPIATPRWESFPRAPRERAERDWQDFVQAAGNLSLPGGDFESSLKTVVALSRFVAVNCLRTPSLALDLWAGGDLHRAYASTEYSKRLADALAGVQSPAQLGERVRSFRTREMVRIAWRDLMGWAPLAVTLEELSALADAVLEQALELLYGWLCQDLGTPRGADGQPQRLVVIAMGKLGARELNFSSDVDLIFAFPEQGQLREGAGLSHQEFFTRLGQRLIQVLSVTTQQGLVFRVDMRLRPFGDSGPLAVTFESMEQYYQAHGREWERYAWVKARVAAGDKAAGARLLDILRPFVYRRYLDYGAYQAMRQMKQLIHQEVSRKGLEQNIKLGRGGIREIEFTVQVFQLIRGGRLPVLQQRSLLTVLDLLARHRLLPDYVCQDLAAAYVFLRSLEHRLQEFADQQTHDLPGDEEGRLRLALAMGYADWSALSRALEGHRRRVHTYFEQVFVAPQAALHDGTEQAAASPLAAVWHGTLDQGQAVEVLARAGYDTVDEAWERIVRLRESSAVRALSPQGRAQLDRLMPLLLGAGARTEQPTAALQRMLALVETIARRTAYLSLLVENPLALSQLVKLCAASLWLSRLLARHPLLLDELLDARTLYSPLHHDALVPELERQLEHVADDDLEQQMDALRQFKQAQVLRVAAADIGGVLPLRQVSDYLTAIAEVILEQVVDLAFAHLRARHGEPFCMEAGRRRRACFAVVGYGKLGGFELGYGSDLDLVFLHDSAGEHEETDGPRPIDNHVFFSRLAQRIIHILTTHTHAGVLYPVDARLRPSGASGLLVSSVESFADYQRTRAWTWEYQALIRARPVTGCAEVAQAFVAVRKEVLARARDPARLREEVCSMRERMRAAEARGEAAGFDLKQGRGGIVDIEFMVQYGVLRWAHDHPELLSQTAALRLLEALARAGRVAREHREHLTDAYLAYRGEVHRLTLQEKPPRVPADAFPEHRDRVVTAWRELLAC